MAKSGLGEIIELRADRALLNPDFDHYLLSGRQSGLYKVALPTQALSTSPSSVQWGYQHSKLFSEAERLTLDLFNSSADSDHLYTFLDNGSLIKTVYEPKNARFGSTNEVATIRRREDRSDLFPPSLSFPDLNVALISNGDGLLTIYDTQDRAQESTWTKIVSYVFVIDGESDTVAIALSDDSNVGGLPFLIVDSRRTAENQLSILLEAITEKKRSELLQTVEHPNEKSPFFSRLIWIDINLTDKFVLRTREAHFNAHLELSTLNHNATELITIGPTNPIFTFDSKFPISSSDIDSADTSQTTGINESVEKPRYVWTQDAEEIEVKFALAESVQRADVVYKLTSQYIDLEVKGVKVLSGELEGTVHLDSSTWIIDEKSLQITLFKTHGHFWRELIKGDKTGLYNPDPNAVSSVLESLEKFTSDKQATSTSGAQSNFNTEQLEEVDMNTEDTMFICWTGGDSHNCIQTMDASCSQLLFDTRIQAGGPKSIATRHENDGILWSLNEGDLQTNKRIAHKFTLDAYGYVVAGHQQKLFSGCSPDGSFGTVIHVNHHIFVYNQGVPVGNGCELTNRKTKKQFREIKEQMVINTAGLFEQSNSLNSGFIGFSASNTVIYLLTKGFIIACHVK